MIVKNKSYNKTLFKLLLSTPFALSCAILPAKASGHKTQFNISPFFNHEVVSMKAVKDTVPKDTNKVFKPIEKYPEFPGGLPALGRFLAKNIRYPARARENNTQGRVMVNFIVEKDGALTDIHVVNSVGDGCDEEAVRVMKLSPKWIPAMQKGAPVRCSYTIPVSFTLAD